MAGMSACLNKGRSRCSTRGVLDQMAPSIKDASARHMHAQMHACVHGQRAGTLAQAHTQHAPVQARMQQHRNMHPPQSPPVNRPWLTYWVMMALPPGAAVTPLPVPPLM